MSSEQWNLEAPNFQIEEWIESEWHVVAVVYLNTDRMRQHYPDILKDATETMMPPRKLADGSEWIEDAFRYCQTIDILKEREALDQLPFVRLVPITIQ